ncbi:MAG: hypothetical protein ACRBHB_15185 [Arenicella sp.]
MKNVIAAVLAGIVIFVWGFISWTAIPWHDAVVNKFSDEAAVTQVLVDNSPQTGVYYLPHAEEDYAVGKPSAFVNMLPEGHSSGMAGMMIKSIIGNIIIAFLVICLLLKTTGLGFVQKVGFVALTGLIIGIAGNFPYWNWFGFPTGYTVVMILDTVITWVLVGLVLAKLVETD